MYGALPPHTVLSMQIDVWRTKGSWWNGIGNGVILSGFVQLAINIGAFNIVNAHDVNGLTPLELLMLSVCVRVLSVNSQAMQLLNNIFKFYQS